MTSEVRREALDHVVATAAIGLALTGLGDVLPALLARQAALSQATAGYAALSLLTAAGMGLYSLIKAHQAELAADLARVLDTTAAASGPEPKA